MRLHSGLGELEYSQGGCSQHSLGVKLRAVFSQVGCQAITGTHSYGPGCSPHALHQNPKKVVLNNLVVKTTNNNSDNIACIIIITTDRDIKEDENMREDARFSIWGASLRQLMTNMSI